MRTVAEVIDSQKAEILLMWTAGARQAVFAEGLTEPELANMMPAYLSLLGRASLRDDVSQLTEAQQRLLEGHLSNRLRQGSSLNEILTEFATLGRCVSHFLDAGDGVGRPSVPDIAHLFEELTLTCAAVSRIFTEHLLEDEQTEKRYARLLHQIGRQSLAQGHAMSLSRHMKETLVLIRQALGAQVATVLLGKGARDAIAVGASNGVAEEAMEAFVRGLEIAGRESVQPPIDDALRRGGILAVLGVGVSSWHAPGGVLCVGIAEARPFTPSEVRRLQGLGEILIVHLDNVRLNGERELLLAPLAAARAGAQALVDGGGDDAGATARAIARNLDLLEEILRARS